MQRERVTIGQRRWALGLTAAFLLGQLSSFAHLLFVPHVTCPDHGELIHPGEPAGPAPVELADRAVSATAATPEHGHDHCLLASSRREDTAAAAVVEVTLDEGFAVVPAPPACAGWSGIALLRLAPKGSPPA